MIFYKIFISYLPKIKRRFCSANNELLKYYEEFDESGKQFELFQNFLIVDITRNTRECPKAHNWALLMRHVVLIRSLGFIHIS